jgi:hypothetical protein
MPTSVDTHAAPHGKSPRAMSVQPPSHGGLSQAEPLLISAEGKPDVKSLNLKAAVNQVLDAHGQALASLPIHKAMMLQREVLRALREQIEATETGSLNIPWLGNFKVHPARPGSEGAPARARRVTFTPARNRPAESAGQEAADTVDGGQAPN